jgi:regulator of replication initiation timing
MTRIECQHKVQELSIRQGEIRTNSHGIQLKGLLDRAHMLAEGGEWAEQEVSEIKQGIEAQQEEVHLLKLDNQDLRGQVEGLEKNVHAQKEKEKAQEKENECPKERVASLEKEVHILKEKDDLWEKRLAILEQLHKGTKGDQ